MHDVVKNVLETWASFFSNHAAVRTLLGFLHVGGLLAGGGCAIFADRLILRTARRNPEARQEQLHILEGIHRIVLTGLAAIVVSGVLLFAADTDTYLYSKFFWIKMGLFLLLMANGALLVSAERKAERGDERAWKRLTLASGASVLLWFLTTLIGAALPNIG
jgi:uncharacterized membrane protein